MKILVYLMTLALFSTAVAQNPTILQGSYISNVFGQSNFIKNPNAQTNLVNVTTVTATVVRSTTTPLVATSEFTVAIGTANGTATWSTRTFDAGMKNNNCEARFSYRGFAATSKVDIKQGANTVASLNLTPATDPRIASINFPCGDLSTATTFVVTDTSTLAGTNEIGGIYVGLATNMANVAQAEMFGGIEYGGGTTNTWTIAQTTYASDFAANGSNGSAFGKCTAPGTAIPQLICNNMPAGEYQVVWPIFLEVQIALNAATCRVIEASTGAVSQEVFLGGFNTGTASYTGRPVVITGNVSFSSAGSRTFKLQCKVPTGNVVAIRSADQNNAKTVIYRFPSASELVVTPERQNTWAGVVYTAENQTLFAGVAAPTASTPYTNATWNQPTKLKGKASVTTTNSGNDLGFSVANLSVGNYKFDVTGLLNSEIPSVGGVHCNFRLIETNTNEEIAAQLHGNRVSTVITRDFVNAFTGVFNNTSVATRNFRIEAQKVSDTASGNGGSCQAYSATIASSDNTKLAIIMTPLDQPSNSALFVQGPVKAAETGAVLSAGYMGEIITSTSATSGSFLTGVTTKNVATITLQPGTWLLSANLRFEPVTTFNFNAISISATSSFDDTNAIQPQAAVAGSHNTLANLTKVVRVTSPSTSYQLNTFTWLNSGTGNYSQLVFTATRIGSN